MKQGGIVAKAMRLWVERVWSSQPFQRKSVLYPTLIFIVSGLWHLFLLSHAAPNVFPDSGSYNLLAEALRDGRWHSGFTFRTPGYPAFLWGIFSLAGWLNWHAVLIVQGFLGSTIPVLLYALFLQLTEKRWVAAIAGLGFLLDRFSIGLETVPLTEFLSGYTVLLASVAFIYGLRSKRLWKAILAGLIAGINFLVRPSFQYLYFVWGLCALGLCWQWALMNWDRKHLIAWLGIFFLVIHLVIAAWSYVVWQHTSVFAPSLQLGASMTNHTGTMMEYAPDKFAKIRDIYVEERNRRGGDHINLFDQSGWKICEATSMTLWQLSLKFGEINRYLIFHYPGKYFDQVARAWIRIWTEDSMYITDLTDPIGSGLGKVELTPLFQFLVNSTLTLTIYQWMDEFVWFNKSFLMIVPFLLVGGTLYLLLTRPGKFFHWLTAVVVLSTILYHMAVHALVQYTEFGRYKLPVQGIWFSYLLFLCIIISVDILGRVKASFDPVAKTTERRRK
jgi:hypothetical protein